jgi:hypothetical protein
MVSGQEIDRNETAYHKMMIKVNSYIQTVLCLVLFVGFVRGEQYTQPRVPGDVQTSSVLIFDRRESSNKFLVQTVDGEGLDDRLKASMKTISHSFGKVVVGANTLVTVGEKSTDKAISLGTAYRLDGTELKNPLEMGRVSIFLGKAPLTFEPAEHLWSGSVMSSEFICRTAPSSAKFKLIREICVDHHGRAFIALRLTGQNQSARELLKTKDFSYRLDGVPSTGQSWRVWYRQPDGTLIRPGRAARTVECGLTGNRTSRTTTEFFIAVTWSPKPLTDSRRVSPEDVELESQISKSHPISSIKSAMTRWIAGTFPGWDCPEPWLNKLWAGQVFSICHQLQVNPETETLSLKYDSPNYLRHVVDLRWLRDASIGWRSLHEAVAGRPALPIEVCTLAGPAGEAMLDCQPYPDLRELLVRRLKLKPPRDRSNFAAAVTDYPEMMRWCRSFYTNSDFEHLIDVRLSEDARRVESRVPVGVLDLVVTKIVGLRADGTDRVRISPAEWIRHWPYFAIDNLPYRGHNLTIVWQSPNHVRRYRNPDLGFNVFVDGTLVKHAGRLEPVEVELK